MGSEYVIAVEWMDGRTWEYDHVVGHRVADGMLTIEQVFRNDTIILVTDGDPPPDRREMLHLPLENIRVWEPRF